MSNKLYPVFTELVSKYASTTADPKISLARLKVLCEETDFPACVIILDDTVSVWLNIWNAKMLSLQTRNLSLQEVQRFMPDYYSHQFVKLISYFNDPEHQDNILQYFNCYQLNEELNWVYTCSKLVYTSPDNDIRYILVMGMDVEEFMRSFDDAADASDNWPSISELNTSVEKLKTLTHREKQVLQLIYDEYTSAEIAEILFLSKSSIDAYRKSMLKKLDVKNAIGLLKFAMLMKSMGEEW